MERNNNGFTLVELVVVISILGVLIAILVYVYIENTQGESSNGLGECEILL